MPVLEIFLIYVSLYTYVHHCSGIVHYVCGLVMQPPVTDAFSRTTQQLASNFCFIVLSSVGAVSVTIVQTIQEYNNTQYIAESAALHKSAGALGS